MKQKTKKDKIGGKKERKRETVLENKKKMKLVVMSFLPFKDRFVIRSSLLPLPSLCE